MQHRTFDTEGRRTIVAVFDKGDDPIPMLDDLAVAEHITGASLSAVGAFARAELGYFDRARSEYLHIPVDQQVEVLSIVGDIALDDGAPSTHAHVVLGRRDGSTVGGHLLHAEVWPTLEVVIREVPGVLPKRRDRATGLTLIDLGDGERR